MAKCPACLAPFGPSDWARLTDHLVAEAGRSDAAHVRFLNQNLSRKKSTAPELIPGIRQLFDTGGKPVGEWIVRQFVARFYGPSPHPFVVALQHPRRDVLLGYVFEHQHFLRQWVRSCAEIVARTDQPRVIRYELDNLATEFGGFGPDRPAHYELLLRMGESLGATRAAILSTPPLPATKRGIDGWESIARQEPWVEAVAAMHSLELIANRDLVRSGATIPYFDPAILHGSEIPAAAQAFLREGYEADVTHSSEALALVNEFAPDVGAVEGVQATTLRSFDLFDDYLMARLERSVLLAA
jgi:pyrroloquinoline-quinone synthase